MKIEIFQSPNILSRNRWRFRVRARNGQIVGRTSEGYSTESNARRGVRDLYAAMQVAIANNAIGRVDDKA